MEQDDFAALAREMGSLPRRRALNELERLVSAGGVAAISRDAAQQLEDLGLAAFVLRGVLGTCWHRATSKGQALIAYMAARGGLFDPS